MRWKCDNDEPIVTPAALDETMDTQRLLFDTRRAYLRMPTLPRVGFTGWLALGGVRAS